mgnify:CR=1 FL=1
MIIRLTCIVFVLVAIFSCKTSTEENLLTDYPAIAEDGSVVGIASASLNKLLMIAETASIPENVNFGMASPAIINFLKAKKVKYSSEDFFSSKYSSTELAEIGQESTIQLLCLNTRAAYSKLKRSKGYKDVLLDIN